MGRGHISSSLFKKQRGKQLETRMYNIINIIHNVLASYYQKRIRPYFKFVNLTEIDETKFGAEIYKTQGHCDEFKWIFGMYCRKTKISIMDYVVNRKAHNLLSLVKQFVQTGSIVFSDDASMYTERRGVNSHLCQMGLFHFWINHSKEYTNPKFPFITTSGIERTWGTLKRRSPRLHGTGRGNPVQI